MEDQSFDNVVNLINIFKLKGLSMNKIYYFFLSSLLMYSSVSMAMELDDERQEEAQGYLLGGARRPVGPRNRRQPTPRRHHESSEGTVQLSGEETESIKDVTAHCRRFATLHASIAQFGRRLAYGVGACGFGLGALFTWLKQRPVKTIGKAAKIIGISALVGGIASLIARYTTRFWYKTDEQERWEQHSDTIARHWAEEDTGELVDYRTKRQVSLADTFADNEEVRERFGLSRAYNAREFKALHAIIAKKDERKMVLRDRERRQEIRETRK